MQLFPLFFLLRHPFWRGYSAAIVYPIGLLWFWIPNCHTRWFCMISICNWDPIKNQKIKSFQLQFQNSGPAIPGKSAHRKRAKSKWKSDASRIGLDMGSRVIRLSTSKSWSPGSSIRIGFTTFRTILSRKFRWPSRKKSRLMSPAWFDYTPTGVMRINGKNSTGFKDHAGSDKSDEQVVLCLIPHRFHWLRHILWCAPLIRIWPPHFPALPARLHRYLISFGILRQFSRDPWTEYIP